MEYSRPNQEVSPEMILTFQIRKLLLDEVKGLPPGDANPRKEPPGPFQDTPTACIPGVAQRGCVSCLGPPADQPEEG